MYVQALPNPGQVITTCVAESLSEVSHSICKLISSLGDHSNTYFASNITSLKPVADSPKTKSQLIQSFLRLLLSYTGLPGYYGADEEESEMTLGFWYLFQESLWSVEFDGECEQGDTQPGLEVEEQNRMTVVHAVYAELVKVLRRKVAWPPQSVLACWAKGLLLLTYRNFVANLSASDQVDKFQV